MVNTEEELSQNGYDKYLDGVKPMSITSEGIKLIKNSKGYNWEIKIPNLEIADLEKINNELLAKFGVGE